MPDSNGRLEVVLKSVQVVSVVAGVVISVLSLTAAREREAEARTAEARKQSIDAARPFLEMRQLRYMEAIRAAGVIASPDLHDAKEVHEATKRFWELYWAELSLVEQPGVEASMIAVGRTIDPGAVPSERQKAVYALAHALRDSLVDSWGVGGSAGTTAAR